MHAVKFTLTYTSESRLTCYESLNSKHKLLPAELAVFVKP